MKSAKQILEDQKAPAIALLTLVLKAYGDECFDWEGPVLKAELQTDYDCEVTDLQSDKIQAASVLLTTELYENYINVFETFNYLFIHQHDSLDEFNPLEPEELVSGLTEAYLIRGENIEFSPEIRVYVGQIFEEYGFHKPPLLFPSAIMKEKEGDDTEKNAAMQEIFEEKINLIQEYLEDGISI